MQTRLGIEILPLVAYCPTRGIGPARRFRYQRREVAIPYNKNPAVNNLTIKNLQKVDIL